MPNGPKAMRPRQRRPAAFSVRSKSSTAHTAHRRSMTRKETMSSIWRSLVLRLNPVTLLGQRIITSTQNITSD
jgi:hypothetical protein